MARVLKYNHAKLAIIDEISRLGLAIGDPLPSERTLTKNLPYSIITIRRALQELVESDVIRKEHGRGNYLQRTIESSPIVSNIGVLRIIRKDRPAYSAGGFFKLNSFLRKRGIGMRYIEADRFNDEIVNAFSDCIGIILVDWLSEEWLDSLKIFSCPMIAIGSNPCPGLVPTVGYDWETAGYMLTTHFISNGYRNIGLINGEADYHPAQQIYAGYQKALDEAKIDVNSEKVLYTSYNASHDEIQHYLQHDFNCDALVVENLFTFLQCSWVHDVKNKPALGWIHTLQNPHSHSPATVVTFPKSLFEKAAEIFLDHLLLEQPLSMLELLKPELLNPVNNGDNI